MSSGLRTLRDLSASAELVQAPSPHVGEGYSDFQHRRLGEGSATPHPTEYVEISAMPSPTRGEGTSAGAVDSTSIHPALERDDMAGAIKVEDMLLEIML